MKNFGGLNQPHNTSTFSLTGWIAVSAEKVHVPRHRTSTDPAPLLDRKPSPEGSILPSVGKLDDAQANARIPKMLAGLEHLLDPTQGLPRPLLVFYQRESHIPIPVLTEANARTYCDFCLQQELL
jgi:hypothetical protein